MLDILRDRIGEESKLGFELAALAVFALLTLTIIDPLSIEMTVAATIVLVASPLVGAWGWPGAATPRNAALGLVAFLVVLGIAVSPGANTVASTTLLIAPLVRVCGFVSLGSRFERPVVRWFGAWLLVAIVATIAVIWIEVVQPPDIDVLGLHISAAETLADGANPYVEARSLDTSPLAPRGAEVIGYPYPPLTMLFFVAAQWVFGDPRWAGAIAIAIAVLLMARPWRRLPGEQSAALLAVGLAVLLQPALGNILRLGWTEPVALPLLVGVGLLWRRHPAQAAVLLGLTFGLKQYWIVALPLLLLWNDDFRWKRAWIAAGVAALSLLPAFLADPAAAWNSMVVALMELPLREDSIGLAGLGVETSLAVLLILTAGVAVWMGWRGGSIARFQLAVAATLATAFLFGSQAFVNYWFLIAVMAMIAVAESVSAPPDDIGRKSDKAIEPVTTG